MGGDEIGGQPFPLAEVEELGDPRVLRRRRPAYPEPRVDSFDGLHGVPVELEVVRLGPGPEVMEVGLVPALEEPLAHLARAVAVDPVADELLDQRPPLPVVPGRRDVSLVAEYGVAARGERLGHEGELDEGPHSVGEQEVHVAVGVEELIEELLVLADQRPHQVREDAVEAHVAEAELPVAAGQLGLPVGAQRQWRVAAAHRVLPEMLEGARRPGPVAGQQQHEPESRRSSGHFCRMDDRARKARRGARDGVGGLATGESWLSAASLAAVSGWGQAGVRLERAREMTLVGEPGRKGDPGDRIVGLDESPGRPLESKPPYPPVDRLSIAIPECARKVGRMHACLVGHLR